MPMNAAVFEMFPEKRRIWARRYSRSKASRASRSGVPMIERTACPGTSLAGSAVTSGGSMSISMLADALCRRQDQRPFDDIAQLADIARPVIGLQRRHGVVGQCRGRNPPLGGIAGEEILHQLGHILAPFGQRRHAHRNDIEPVVKILAEAPGGDFSDEIARCRADHPHIDAHPAAAADALKDLFGQHAQDLGLRRSPACRRRHQGTACRHAPVRTARH